MGLGAKSAYAVSPGFTQWGTSTVEWKVDNNKLIIQPLDNAPKGTMPNVNNVYGTSLPWNSQKESITEVEFKGSIKSSKNLKGLFKDMTSLRSIDFGDLDTSQATSMYAMFSNCYALTSLDFSGFDTSNATDMYSMFGACSSLTSLDLSSFNTSNVENMNSMFYYCSNLATIYVGSGWNTNFVERSDIMFMGCTSLQGGNGTRYVPVSTDNTAALRDKTRAHIDGGTSNPGYLTLGYEVTPPSVSSLTYGETPLFEGGSVTFGQGTDQSPQVTVEGTWSLDPNAPKPQAGDTSLSLVFTPNDSRYQKYRTNHTTITIPQVSKRPITSVTPESNQFKQYNGSDGSDPTLTYQPRNLAPGDIPEEVFTGSLTRQDGYLPGQYDIGIGSLNLKTDGKGKNYSFDTTTGFTTGVKFTIKPTGTVPIPQNDNAIHLTYNGQSQSPHADHVNFDGDTSETNVSENGYTATATPEEGYVWSGLTDSYDHSPQTVKWFITKKDITVTAEDKQSEVGKQEKTLTFTVDTLAPGDTKEEVFSGSLERANSGVTAPNTYDILQGSLTTEGTTKGVNYNIVTFNKGTYTITSAGNVVPPTPQSLTYNGEEQDAFAGIDLTKFDIEGNIQINANAEGEHYTATITPKGSYVWSDTQDQKPLPINWTISPLPITVQAKDAQSTFDQPLESFDYDTNPALPGNDLKTDVFTGSLACSVTPRSNPGTYEIGVGSLALNTEGEGKNYSFNPDQDFIHATYTLNAIGSIPVPEAVDNLVYNGTEQTGVEPVGHVELTDNKATDASDNYLATATLEEGYIWSGTGVDFDHSSKTINWSIKKCPITVSINDQQIYPTPTPNIVYTLSDESYRSEITGSLYVNEDTNTPGRYEIKTDKLTSDNLDLAFGNTASLTVNAKPVFPGGGGNTPGPVNPNNPDNPNDPNNPDNPDNPNDPNNPDNPNDPNDPNNPNNSDDPNGSNPPAAPTDPSVPIKGDPGWSHINGNWYYYNLSGILISGWISDSHHWYYLDDKGIMQVGWLLDPQDNNWYYLNNTQGDTYGAMQTGWLLDVDGAWYYLNPISDGTLGSVQSGWLYIDDTWYYANPTHDTTFGALQEGWLSYNDTWYYLYPIHDGSFGYMYTGFNLIDMRPYVFTDTGELIS